MVRVRPGVALVLAILAPSRELMTLDFPTLERPKKATSGSDAAGNCAASEAALRNRARTFTAPVCGFHRQVATAVIVNGLGAEHGSCSINSPAYIQAGMAQNRASRRSRKTNSRVTAGALPADELKASFPRINLPLKPPFAPMEAKSVAEIPAGNGWLYEPKWDGFRALAFRKGNQVLLQSKSGQPLGRYFPELVQGLKELPQQSFVLDGEIVI